MLTSDGDYRGAVAAYDRAIAAHEDFATAYTGRARARLLAANPDYPVTRAFTDSRGSQTAAAVADAQRALDLGGHRDLLGEGLARARRLLPSATTSRRSSSADAAIEINPDVPDVWLLKSAAQLALGDDAGADASLTKALRLLDGSDPSQRTRLLAASYLSYLASVAHNEPARAAAGTTPLGPRRRHRDRVHARTKASRVPSPRPDASGSTTSGSRTVDSVS